ncbi:MAG: hypothetical protein JXA37_09010 [Chloroflexia bacterium]|nr:hypothetical protein [Chloroflexia bacterium]
MIQALLIGMGMLGAGGSLLLLLSRWLQPRWSAWLSLNVLALASLPLLAGLRGPDEIVLLDWIWRAPGPIQFVYRLDALAAAFALLAVLFSLLLLLWMALGARPEEGRFAPWTLLLLAAQLHLLCSGDLLVAYAGWELVLLAMYFLLVYRREKIPTPGIAEWFLGVQHLAGYPLLVALILIDRSGQSLYIGALLPGAIGPTVLLLLLGSAWIRTAQVPFHAWATAAAESPGPVSTLLLGSGSFLLAPYLWLRLLSGAAVHGPRDLVMILGTVSLLGGAVLAMRQERGRQVQAGDTISRMGLLWLALGLDTALAIPISLFLLADLLLSKLLFHLALAEGRLSLAARRTIFLLAGWGAAGLPLSLGFVGRCLLLRGLLWADRPLYIPFVLLSTPLALAYLWRGWSLLSAKEAPDPLPGWAQASFVALSLPFLVAGLATAGLGEWLQFEPAARIVEATAPLVLQQAWGSLALSSWGPAWMGLLLLIGLGGAFWSGILRRPSLPQEKPAEGALTLLPEPPRALLGESAWLAWLAQPKPVYRFAASLFGRALAAFQQLVTFLEQQTTYFLLVTLILAAVILIVMTR